MRFCFPKCSSSDVTPPGMAPPVLKFHAPRTAKPPQHNPPLSPEKLAPKQDIRTPRRRLYLQRLPGPGSSEHQACGDSSTHGDPAAPPATAAPTQELKCLRGTIILLRVKAPSFLNESWDRAQVELELLVGMREKQNCRRNNRVLEIRWAEEPGHHRDTHTDTSRLKTKGKAL